MKLATPDKMKKWEKEIFSRYDIPSFLFMEQAGHSLFSFILEKLKLEKYKKIAVVTGKGNNGGDGIVCARYLKEAGYDVTVFALFDEFPKSKDAFLNFKFYKDTHGKVFYVNPSNLEEFTSYLSQYALIVDAILGIGVKRGIEGFYRDVIEILNRKNIPILSVDAPSGIDLFSGRILNVSIKADYTITFALPKIGLYVYPGRYFAGKIMVEPVGFPQFEIEKFPTNDFLIDREMVLSIYPLRLPWGHKGTFGKVLTLSGSKGFTGASYLTSMAVLKAGAGLSYLALPEGLEQEVKSLTPEVITYSLIQKDGHIAYAAYDDIIKLIEGIDALALGPGMGKAEGVKRLVTELIQVLDKPFVLDADAINVLEGEPDIFKQVKTPFVMTPHPGEMGRLLGLPASEVDENRVDIAREFSLKYKDLVLVLKGATTIVAKDGVLYYNETGNSGMATAGSGDVLTGIISAFLGRGVPPLESAILGVYIHGLTGDMAVSYKGESGLLATDLLAYLPYVLKDIEEEVK